MAKERFRFALVLAAVILLMESAAMAMAQSRCAMRSFSSNKRLYSLCSNLPELGSTLQWSQDANSSLLHLAFSASPAASSGWISWGINPDGLAMIGTQALLAFRSSNGSMDVGTYNISAYRIRKSEIGYRVSDLGAEYGTDGVMTIFATLELPTGTSMVNQVWQVGPGVADGVPVKHSFDPANLAARSTLDLAAGGISSRPSRSRIRKANTHGILNAIGWGILIPIGAIIARYLRAFEAADPAWFYLHAACQVSGYSVGVAGWATGLDLGNESKGIQRTTHRAIGIAVFCLASLQILALLWRPGKNHKLRVWWNAYHHGVGYAVIALGIVNIFRGFSILKPPQAWKTAYVAVVASLGALALSLELLTWALFFLRRRRSNKPPLSSSL